MSDLIQSRTNVGVTLRRSFAILSFNLHGIQGSVATFEATSPPIPQQAAFSVLVFFESPVVFKTGNFAGVFSHMRGDKFIISAHFAQ